MLRYLLVASLLAGTVPAPAAAAAAPAPAAAAVPAKTRFGVIASTQGTTEATFENYVKIYDEKRRRYGGPIGIRVFSSGRLPLPGENTMEGRLLAWAAATHPEEPITLSHKTRDDARLPGLLEWVRAKGVRLSLIYFHEPQDDWFRAERRDRRAEPAVYLETYRAYRRIIAAHPAVRSLVTLEKNLMWFWQRYRADPAPHPGDWHAYVEQKDPADLLSWDTYVFPGMPTDQKRYATPDEFFRYALAARRWSGLPWAIGEIGSTVQDGVGPGAELKWDAEGTKFAAWVRDITAAASNPPTIGPAYADLPPAMFVKWWGARDRNGSDQSLEQVPAAVDAYLARMQGARL